MVDANTVLLDVVIVEECNIFFCYLIHMLWKIPGADEWFLRRERYLPVNGPNGKSIFPCQSYAKIMFIWKVPRGNERLIHEFTQERLGDYLLFARIN